MVKPSVSQDIIALYDEYTHAPLDRRVFLDRLARLAGGAAAAAAMLPLLENNYALAAIVPENDSRLATETVRIDTDGGPLTAYAAKPADASGPLPAVVVIHENRGLNPHIEDVARRVALAGYVALAPDFLSPSGGTPQDEDRAREMIGALDSGKTLQNALAAVRYARNGRPDVTGRVGVIGFCWGGGLANRVAAADPELSAAVSYYGAQPPADQAGSIKAPLLLHYAGLDQRINAGIPAFTEALEKAGVPYQSYVYEGANHAFNNDTNPARYDERAAQQAWGRTLDFLNRHLKS